MKAILKKIRFEKEEPNIKPTLDNVEAFDFTPNKTKDFKPEHIKELDKDYKDTSKAKEFNKAVIKTPEDTGIKSFVFGNYFQDDPFEEFSGMKAEQVPDKYLDGYYMHRLKRKTNKDVIEMRFLRDYESVLDDLGGIEEEEEEVDPFAGLAELGAQMAAGGGRGPGLDDANKEALQKLFGSYKASVNGPVPRTLSRAPSRASSPISIGEAFTGDPDEPLPELEMTEHTTAGEKIARLNKNARGFVTRKKLNREVIPKVQKEMTANKNLANLVHKKMEANRKQTAEAFRTKYRATKEAVKLKQAGGAGERPASPPPQERVSPKKDFPQTGEAKPAETRATSAKTTRELLDSIPKAPHPLEDLKTAHNELKSIVQGKTFSEK